MDVINTLTGRDFFLQMGMKVIEMCIFSRVYQWISLRLQCLKEIPCCMS